MTEILLFLAGMVSGFVPGLLAAVHRLKGDRTMMETLRVVVLGGPGPWRPPK